MGRMPATEENTSLPTEMTPDEFQRIAASLREQVAAVIVGQEEAVQGVLLCLVAGGHALLEGAPGVGKTSVVRTFARALDLQYRRMQFTPDLMPADITGTNILATDSNGHPTLTFHPGPVFANLILADEINRATPKTQSALLEAMQEGTVTTPDASRPLPQPFCVLATENPIEMQGTYPLPEAQLDRFLLKLLFNFPTEQGLIDIAFRTAGGEEPDVARVADGATLLRMRALARSVPMARHVVEYASQLVLSLQPGSAFATDMVRRLVRYGPSPRGVQALCAAGRVVALLEGRFNLSIDDVRAVALPALRHRLVLGFEAEMENVNADAVIATALRVPAEAMG